MPLRYRLRRLHRSLNLHGPLHMPRARRLLDTRIAAACDRRGRSRRASDPRYSTATTATTKTSVSLAWDPSTDNSGTFSYVVKLDNSLSLTVPQTQTSYTPDWLSPGRTYSFFVYAVDKALNTSGNSNTVTATTQPDLTPPSAPVLSVPN